ncbi:hypothetical protein BST30_11190 [Mycobacterium mantenii]|uniref:Uncharacterized protein n=1 Tax=Mycobacterium mantenii TaxID=560555 RepID=A0A1X0FXK8_MYCNT|nr:hypothetical protein BST30_11190 [Mycobacterium mantenii]
MIIRQSFRIRQPCGGAGQGMARSLHMPPPDPNGILSRDKVPKSSVPQQSFVSASAPPKIIIAR